MDDFYEPITLFRDRLKIEHANNTSIFFEDAVKRSGVNKDSNAATVAKIRSLEKKISSADTSRFFWNVLRVFVILLVVASFAGLMLFILHYLFSDFPSFDITPLLAGICTVVGIGGIVLISVKLNKIIRSLDDHLKTLNRNHAAKMAEAWEQLAPLNRIYEWDTISKLVMKTFPAFVFDPFFSRDRLNEFHQSFGWNDSFNHNNSILFCQSGAINGNPFILGEKLNFWMGTKTYHGSLTITWKELEEYTDSEGNRRTRQVTKTETLHASVDKPAPKYKKDKFVVYGNEAAPDLTFSRKPSNISGVFEKMKLKHKIAKLEKKTRKLRGFTIMSNHEFDARFHAVDRDNEAQFRLLFTPLAQQEMVRLLRDREVGFGDNFSFSKIRKINIVKPDHLEDTNITAAPSIFQHYELAAARNTFNEYSNRYFRTLFFAFAPLLSIPLYQQSRSHSDTYEDTYGKTASFWEYEAIANFHGSETFKHPESITQNILKTKLSGSGSGTQLNVTAHGFRSIKRTDYIPVYGGDGKYHNVPVEWIEYISVSRTSLMVLKEADGLTLRDIEQQSQSTKEWQDFFREWQTEPCKCSFCRSIVSYVP